MALWRTAQLIGLGECADPSYGCWRAAIINFPLLGTCFCGWTPGRPLEWAANEVPAYGGRHSTRSTNHRLVRCQAAKNFGFGGLASNPSKEPRGVFP
jgi:hypothetical protein